MRYEVSGIFCFDVDAESFEEARKLAWQELRQRGVQGCIMEVRKVKRGAAKEQNLSKARLRKDDSI